MKSGILNFARRYDKVQNIMPYINVETLKECYAEQPNTDVKKRFGEELETNIEELLCQMKAFSYYPQKNTGNRESSKHEFGFFKDAIVQYDFAEFLEQIYAVKNSVILSPRNRRLQNVGEKIVFYPYMWQAKIHVMEEESIDHIKLIAFLEQYIADKNFMRYIKLFLDSGIMENPIQSDAELASDRTLTSILMKIYCYHILMEWLCSKADNLHGKVYLCCHEEYFCFRAYNMRDLLKICNGLIDDQGQTGLQIVSNTYIEDVFGKYRRSANKAFFRQKTGVKLRGEYNEYVY